MFKYITNKKAILSGKKEINFIDKKIDTEEHGFVVEIQAIGVCTSDCFNYLYNNTGYFGHEMVGKVLTPYQNFKKGDLVLLLTLFPSTFIFSKIESCIITLLEAADQPYAVLHLLNGNMLLRTVETELN
ncbi:alcohol dehydrogenase catalytic domain-containing protein [Bacillus sp. OA1]|nr:alcohol dehydrogenase catalytic domain-containing protein [Bacillus sp. OA1]